LGFKPWDAVFSGDYYLFEAEDEAIIRKTTPDIPALEKLPMPEVIITARSKDPAYDFISRFFAPQLGILKTP
jgi:predicted PhzF superfamily epimerase YddE/YHI9